jgi:DNA mismatch endonuclease (patch repair protein)
MDKVDPATRSRIMSRVRGAGNKSTEWKLRAALVKAGIRGWALGARAALPGRPDFIFRDAKLAVFVDGCFWHGCRICARTRTAPRTNAAFWRKKIASNMARDARQMRSLRKLGWSAIRIKEHRLAADLDAVVSKIARLTVRKPGGSIRPAPRKGRENKP